MSEWRLVLGPHLPEGSPVQPGTVLYAFDRRSDVYNGHWEYDLPPLPIDIKTPPQQEKP